MAGWDERRWIIGSFARLAEYPRLSSVGYVIWPTYFLLISDAANAYNFILNHQTKLARVDSLVADYSTRV